jgi:hypothetical protein
MSERNEFTPRERGLMIGHTWARMYEGDPADLRSIAGGETTPDIREAVESLLVESDDIENPTVFWEGFAHGVRARLAELGLRQEP